MIKNRKRYILFEIISNKEFSLEMVEKAVFESSIRFLGELGTSEAGISFLPEFWQKNKGVLSANLNYIPKIKVVLSLIKKIGGHDVIVKSIKVFGTLRKIKNILKGVYK